MLVPIELSEELPAIQWHIPGLIPGGYITTVYSQPGVSKTCIGAFLAVQTARKHGSFAGYQVRHGRAVVIDADDGSGIGYTLWLNRFMRVYKDADRRLISLYSVDVDGLTSEDIELLGQDLRRDPPALVVLDSFSSAFPSLATHIPHKVHACLRTIGMIAKESGAAIVVVDSAGKLVTGQSIASKGPLGTVAKLILPRAAFALERVPPADVDGRDVLKLTCTKQSFGPVPPALWLELVRRGDDAFDIEVVEGQSAIQRDADHVPRFFELLGELLGSGQAHLLSREHPQQPPEHPERWGWKPDAAGSLRPGGPHIGWVDRTFAYLLPTATYAALWRHASTVGLPLPSERVLWKRLAERGAIATHQESVELRTKVKLQVGGSRQRVVCVPLNNLEGGYQEWTGSQRYARSDVAPLGQAILELTRRWEDGEERRYRAGELLKELEQATGLEKARVKPEWWPKTAEALAKRLPPLKAALGAGAVVLEWWRDPHTKQMVWILRKDGGRESPPPNVDSPETHQPVVQARRPEPKPAKSVSALWKAISRFYRSSPSSPPRPKTAHKNGL